MTCHSIGCPLHTSSFRFAFSVGLAAAGAAEAASRSVLGLPGSSTALRRTATCLRAMFSCLFSPYWKSRRFVAVAFICTSSLFYIHHRLELPFPNAISHVVSAAGSSKCRCVLTSVIEAAP